MAHEDRFAAVRKQLADPEPELFKFENIGDSIIGTVRRPPYEHVGKEKTLWQMVIDAEGIDTPQLVNLTKDTIKQLVRERTVLPGDLIGISLSEILYDKSNYRVFKVAVDPERPRAAAPAAESAEVWYDENGNEMPAPPYDWDGE